MRKNKTGGEKIGEEKISYENLRAIQTGEDGYLDRVVTVKTERVTESRDLMEVYTHKRLVFLHNWNLTSAHSQGFQQWHRSKFIQSFKQQCTSKGLQWQR